MALYFVRMDLQPDAYPQLPTDGLASIVREAILPSVEALVPLRAAKKLVTGGYLLGERQMVFVFEADSEEEVRQMLDEPIRCSDLAARSDVTLSTMTRLLDGLADARLVQRLPDPRDGRAVRVVLTPAGRQQLEALRRERTTYLVRRIDRLLPEDYQRLLAALPALESLLDDEERAGPARR